MTWNRDWTKAGENVFEALKVKEGDRFVVLYNDSPAGKERLVTTLLNIAKKKNIRAMARALFLDENFNPESI